MGILGAYFSGLAGFLSCWLLGSFAGLISPVWQGGKNAFALYFSLFAYTVLFVPIYFLGHSAFLRRAHASKLRFHSVIYALLLGFAIHPALMAGDLMVSAIEFDAIFSNNGLRLFCLMTITATIDFLFCVFSYLLLGMWTSPRTAAPK